MNERTECLTTEQIRRFFDNARTPCEEALAANAHLQDCARCQQALQDGAGQTVEQFLHRVVPLRNDFASLEDETGCLEDDLIQRYVQGETDDFENEMVTMHLDDCAFCKADVTSLQTLRREMEAERVPSFNDWLISQWQHFWKQLAPVSTKPVLAFSAGAIAASCFLYVALVLPLRNQFRDQLQKQKEALQGQAQQLEAQSAVRQKEMQSIKAQILAQAKIASRSRNELASANSELDALRRQQKLTLSLDAALPMALDSGQKNLQAVASYHSKTLGPDSKQERHVALVSPVAAIVEAQQPTLGWKPLIGAARYKLEMQIPTSNKELDTVDVSTRTAWKINRALSRGIVYQWQIVAYNDKNVEIGRSNSVQFKVLDAQTAQHLTEFAGSPLTRCTLYINAGMPVEAEKELQSYLKENPISPAPTIQQLQRNLEALKQKAQVFAHQTSQP